MLGLLRRGSLGPLSVLPARTYRTSTDHERDLQGAGLVDDDEEENRLLARLDEEPPHPSQQAPPTDPLLAASRFMIESVPGPWRADCAPASTIYAFFGPARSREGPLVQGDRMIVCDIARRVPRCGGGSVAPWGVYPSSGSFAG